MSTIGTGNAYLVKYHFDAAGENELSIYPNEILDEVEEPRNDWVLVRKRESPTQKGYVPLAFVELYDPSILRNDVREPVRSAPRPPGASIGSGQADPRSSSPLPSPLRPNPGLGNSGNSYRNTPASSSSSSSSTSSSSSLSVSAAANQGHHSNHHNTNNNTMGSGFDNNGGAGGAGGGLGVPPPASSVLMAKRQQQQQAGMGMGGLSGASPLPAVVDSFSEMLTDFRTRLSKIMEERDEAFRKLERSIGATSKEIQACQDRNTGLTQKIMDLDSWIEEEKAKWREQLENEKRNQKLRASRMTPR
eukprot:ANDGO_02355.mRNA.1 SH3 domain protein-like protein